MFVVLIGELALVGWHRLAADRRSAAAWRRVGHCSAVGDSTVVTCVGVHLVVITLPPETASCAVLSICSVKVNREARPAFEGALRESVAAGLGGAIPQFQTVNRRRCRDATSGGWIPDCVSKHSYGIAVDFRPVDDNRHWESVTDKDPRIMEVVTIFRRYGFRWGGTFASNFDPQHLEWKPGAKLPTRG